MRLRRLRLSLVQCLTAGTLAVMTAGIAQAGTRAYSNPGSETFAVPADNAATPLAKVKASDADNDIAGTFGEGVTGQCGSAHNATTPTAPITNLCSAGTPTAVVTNPNTFTWTCAGSGGSTATCSAPRQYTITASVNPNGGGTVICTGNTVVMNGASGTYTAGNTVSCTPVPASGFVFGNWSGDCTGSTSCSFPAASGNKTIDATFRATYTLTVTVVGNGSVSGPSGPTPVSGQIANCTSAGGANCSAVYRSGDTVSPSHAQTPPTVFSGWSGACSGLTCSVSMTQNQALTATFVDQSAGACGAAHGQVAATAPGANLCSAGTPSAVVTNPNTFTWTCAGSGGGSTATCSALRQYTITASVNPNGGGTVICTGNTVVMNGASGTYTAGNTVSCTPVPASGFVFGNWSGDCTGSTSCSFPAASGNKTVNATFVATAAGACGTASGVASATAPTQNLCTNGSASGMSANAPWTWTCPGSNGGASAQCRAPGLQAITAFVANPTAPAFVPNGTFTVSATGGASGNAVTFTIAPASAGVCRAGGANGATITMLAAGTCSVLANQAGNSDFAAAPQVALDVRIAGGPPPPSLEPIATPALSDLGRLLLVLVMIGFGGYMATRRGG